MIFKSLTHTRNDILAQFNLKHLSGKVIKPTRRNNVTLQEVIRHESAIKEKTLKSQHRELHKREALTQRSWGSGGRCEPSSGSRAEPWWGPRGQSPRKISRIFL